MTKEIDEVIELLEEFSPSTEDDSINRLYEILGAFSSLPGKERAMPAMFGVMERLRSADLGSPGPIVHELETIPGYETELQKSLSRKPTWHSAWMVNRILNSKSGIQEREKWLTILSNIEGHPLAPEDAKESAYEYIEQHLGRRYV